MNVPFVETARPLAKSTLLATRITGFWECFRISPTILLASLNDQMSATEYTTTMASI